MEKIISRVFPLFGILFLTGCTFFSQPLKQNTATPGTNPTRPAMTVTVSISAPTELPKITLSPQKIYLIALDDGGKSGPLVGCGDSLVAVEIAAGNPESALQTLLDQHSRQYGQSGLYNALYQSNLKINRFETKSGGIEVDLSGSLVLGGVCDDPRVNDQLKATIRQSTNASTPVIIRINGVLLEDFLSGK
ncbi:MAG TPA: hypothetical protein VF338_02410 [Leptolinea sp.]